jgi:hypothetical protein
MKATESQIERATRMSEASKMPFEMALRMIVKQDLRNTPRLLTKKDIRKIEQRKAVESNNCNLDSAELLRRNAMKNLPSSMR